MGPRRPRRDADNDLAVIAVDPTTRGDDGTPIASLLRPVTLGNSDAVRIGEQAIAIGSPSGLQQTVAAGIVSARRYPGEDSTSQLDLIGGALQTDAAINPGNSDGPLWRWTEFAWYPVGNCTVISRTPGGREIL